MQDPSIKTDARQNPTDYLVHIIQRLSMAKDLPSIMVIVRQAARALTGADGATFVLRDGDQCYYAEEDAISPLWKGKRFPMSTCISGWVMNNKKPAVIEDIYSDPRIPADAYKITFVRSLAMVPIRTEAPIGAIGNYWARHHKAGQEELELLQALANSASIAMENVRLYEDLERQVSERTSELEQANQELALANRELEAFSWSVSHDLRAPLRAISGFTQALEESLSGRLNDDTKLYLGKIITASSRMAQLIEDLLKLSGISRSTIDRTEFDFGRMTAAVFADIQIRDFRRAIQFSISDNLRMVADSRLMRIVMENLLNNAWKYSSKITNPVITVGCHPEPSGPVYYVSDNGAGFDSAYADKLFTPFQRLHSEKEYPGIGIGLAIVQRIIHKHGGRIWAESSPGNGATFYFTVPES